MFDKILGGLGDFDTDKVVQVVNLVWDNREKLVDLLENLPELLRDTGESIESAGESAVKASVFLVGDKRKDTPGAGELSEMAAGALEKCYQELRDASRLMDKIGREIDDVRIPSIKPKYINVMGHKLVSGLDIGESQLVDDAANRLKDGSDRLEEIGRELRDVAKHMAQLGGALTEAGGDLNNVGVKLKDSGTKLRSVIK